MWKYEEKNNELRSIVNRKKKPYINSSLVFIFIFSFRLFVVDENYDLSKKLIEALMKRNSTLE